MPNQWLLPGMGAQAATAFQRILATPEPQDDSGIEPETSA